MSDEINWSSLQDKVISSLSSTPKTIELLADEMEVELVTMRTVLIGLINSKKITSEYRYFRLTYLDIHAYKPIPYNHPIFDLDFPSKDCTHEILRLLPKIVLEVATLDIAKDYLTRNLKLSYGLGDIVHVFLAAEARILAILGEMDCPMQVWVSLASAPEGYPSIWLTLTSFQPKFDVSLRGREMAYCASKLHLTDAATLYAYMQSLTCFPRINPELHTQRLHLKYLCELWNTCGFRGIELYLLGRPPF